MGVLGTILSIVPTVAGVVGKLFGVNTNDYITFTMRRSSLTDGDLDENVYFKKGANGEIFCHNGCTFPVQLSVENKIGLKENIPSDVIIDECASKDVTQLIADYSAQNVDRIRISANVQPEEGNNAAGHIVALTCRGKLYREITTSMSMGKYISMQIDGEDICIIAHDGCEVKEISSFSVSGEGGEPEHLYENLTSQDVTTGITGQITKATVDSATVIRFKAAATPFNYSEVLKVEATLVCEISSLPQRCLLQDERKQRMESADWDFLRTGRCLNR